MAEHHPLRTPDQDPTTQTYAQLNANAEKRAKSCRSAQLPSLKHLQMKDYETVYEPSDDTYLLIDAIGYDMDLMETRISSIIDGDDGNKMERSKIKRTCEIGCGTGVPSVYLAMRLRGIITGGNTDIFDNSKDDVLEGEETSGRDSVVHYVTDINPNATRIAKWTAEVNGIPLEEFHAIQCDLASEINDPVEILIFNPPYVPTPDEEVGSNAIEASWAGGKNGRVVLDRALSDIARLLAFPHGVAYVVVVDDNYPEELAEVMKERYEIKVTPMLRRRARNEFLTILRMTPTRAFHMMEGMDVSTMQESR
ncbi:hypothetical protein ACHAXS_003900 [Conticribra weissflogii]